MPVQQLPFDPQLQLLSEREASKLLHISPATLQTWRCRSRYALKFVRVGSRIFYRLSDISSWLEERTQQPVEPRHFAEQRAKRKQHRAALKRAATARPAERPRTKPKAKRARR
jgi:hypothetical protein